MMIESAEQFVFLRSSQDPELYQRAALEEATEEIWYEVIEKYPAMKTWVAHNKTVPVSILEILSRDTDPLVRSMVAMKRKVGAEILQRLAQDIDDSVRLHVAINAKTPRSILEELLQDAWPEVVEVATRRLKNSVAKDVAKY
jgi:hypothetical protein